MGLFRDKQDPYRYVMKTLAYWSLEQYTHSDLLQLNFLKISEAERKVIMAWEKLLSLSSNMHKQERFQMYMYVVSHYDEKTAQRYSIVQIK